MVRKTMKSGPSEDGGDVQRSHIARDSGQAGSDASKSAKKDGTRNLRTNNYGRAIDDSDNGNTKNRTDAGRRHKNHGSSTSSSSTSGKSNKSNRNQESTRSNTFLATVQYNPHLTLDECISRYNAGDPTLMRGVLRVLPGTTTNTTAFCTCDRGRLDRDVLIDGTQDVNRAMHGDTVFVELHDENEQRDDGKSEGTPEQHATHKTDQACIQIDSDDDGGDIIIADIQVHEPLWQDDPMQMDIWAPVVPIRRRTTIRQNENNNLATVGAQRKGHVVSIILPRQIASEINPTEMTQTTHRTVVGTLKRLQSGNVLFVCSNKSMPQFFCPKNVLNAMREKRVDERKNGGGSENDDNIYDSILFQAKYRYGSWSETSKWPPCADLEPIGEGGNVHDETRALLLSNGVDHGEFPTSVLAECGRVVQSGEFQGGWKPKPEMYEGRRDYRHKRIFTIDPTTARDLDDALHVELLDNGQAEIGVHIADVSHFVTPGSEIDQEAQRRCTTVYLVDRVIPMLPRPLCEIACSLNENVERLAYSCVWRMNLDGTMISKNGDSSLIEGKPSDVWYGRTVIKSCARLDYATAQNIIDNKVCAGEAQTDESLWPMSRRPTGGHTMEQVAADVRLMNRIAQARRQLRFANGALALSAVKLTFQLGDDGETPTMVEPYPIRDSNRLVEEYMLLANFLVAQRLITHADDMALLRHHEPPLEDGLEEVKRVAKAAVGFDIDITSSQALQATLNRLGLECRDPLVLQCVTQMLKTPFKPANYIAAGEFKSERWAHFALNCPYYTHFTSPIRRYADVMVHRILQATIDDVVDQLPYNASELGKICGACNEKKDSSRLAQERSDEVFLALYLQRQPLKSQLGIVLSVGKSTFKVYVPSIGMTIMLFLEEHKSWITWEAYEHQHNNRIRLERASVHDDAEWNELTIQVFAKIKVGCVCHDRPPISVKLRLEGPWVGE